jgi:ribulose-phosphate 3-epimerase
MTESPVAWANAAAAAGADTIIVSTNTAGVRAALRRIHELGKRNGIALNPESSVDILKPVLKEIDEILIMSVKPGAGGQEFDDSVLNKISVLANTRKRYGLKFKISVDGGINPQTAKMCWDAGADFLASGSYLAKAADFPMAVQSLLRD